MAEEEAITLPLPPGWAEQQDEDGDSYFVDPDGEAQWDRPKPPLDYLTVRLFHFIGISCG